MKNEKLRKCIADLKKFGKLRYECEQAQQALGKTFQELKPEYGLSPEIINKCVLENAIKTKMADIVMEIDDEKT